MGTTKSVNKYNSGERTAMNDFVRTVRRVYDSGELPTHPSPNPFLTPFYLKQNTLLGEG